jgi:hypothetical protein
VKAFADAFEHVEDIISYGKLKIFFIPTFWTAGHF